MLPRSRRIPKEEFSRIVSNAKRFNTPHFLLYATPLPKSSQESRFSFSVSKKVAKTAVDRNRERRRGYASIKRLIKRVSPGYLLYFSFKKGSVSLKEPLMSTEIQKLLLDAGVIS